MTFGRVTRITPLLLLLLAACGEEGRGGDVTGPPDPPPLPVIDSATVLRFTGTAHGQMQAILHTIYGGQDLGTPNLFLLPSLGAPAGVEGVAPRRAAAREGCTPAQTGLDSLGVAIDSDLDGVPDDNTVDFGPGCSFLDGGLEYTFSGKYRLRDPGGGVMDWEYTTTALAAKVRDTLTGDFFRQEVSGTETAHFSAAHAAHQMDVTLEITSRSGIDSTHLSLRTLEASTYDPTAGSTFQLHGSLPQGTLGLGAELTFRDLAAGADPRRFVLSTPVPIHTSFSCDSGIDGGKLLGLFEGDDRVGFRLTWPACGNAVLEVFGTTP